MNMHRSLFLTIIIILSFIHCSNNTAHDIDSSMLNRYAGHYKGTDNFSITITSQHGFLYYQPTTQDYGDKLSAITQQTFSQEEWGKTFIEFRKTPGTEEYDLFIVRPDKPPLRFPRTEQPAVMELEEVGHTPIEVSFQEKNDRQDKITQTLESLDEQGNLYTINYSADYSEFINQTSNWNYRVKPGTLDRNKIKCTLFSISSNSGQIIYGRNFDNEVCNVVAVKYQPVNGYRSIGFTRLSDLGFEKDEDLLSLPLKKRTGLLAAPCFTADGMNEKGVVFGLASVTKQPAVIDPKRETAFLMRLCREILDHAANVDEAIAITGKYNIYDEKEGSNYSIAHHLLVSDANGDSVVLENSGGQMRVIRKTLPWQLATNSPLYKVNERDRKINCQRYQILTALLKENREKMNWQKGMQFLRRVAVKGNHAMSCWSSVYDIGERTIYVVIQKKYQTPLKLTF